MQSYVLGLAVILCGLYVKFLWGRRRLYELAKKIPGSEGLPLIGHGYKFFNSDLKKILFVLESKSKEFPGLKKIWLGPKLLILANTPESLQIALNSQLCLDKPSQYKLLPYTKALAFVGGDVWKRHRKVLNPSFGFNVIQTQLSAFDEKSKILVKNLENKVGQTLDFYDFAMACSLETLLKSSFDIDRDYQSDPLNVDYIYHTEKSIDIYMKKIWNILHHIKPLYKFSRLYQLEQKHCLNQMFKFNDDIFDEHQNLLLKTENEIANENLKRPKNFIKTLLDLRNGYNKNEMKQEIGFFLVAGYESSALVISHTLLMLAMHPDVQQHVFEELNDVYGSADAKVDYESIEKLSYLDLVVKETMRLFPPLAITARETAGEIDIGGYTVPAGTTVIICMLSVHRNKLYWGSDADEFKPERFEPKNIKNVHPYAYIPFTGGPRVCIAKRYAILFLKTCLANVLLNYKVSTPLKFDDLEIAFSVTLKIAQRSLICLEKRTY